MSYAEQSSIIVTQGGNIRFATSSSVSSHNASKATVSKIEAKCRTFNPVIFTGRVGEMFE